MGERIGSGKTDRAGLAADLKSAVRDIAVEIMGKDTSETHKVTTVIETKVDGAGKTEKELNKITNAANKAADAINNVKNANTQTAKSAKQLEDAKKWLTKEFSTQSGIKRAMNFTSPSRSKRNAQSAIMDYLISKKTGVEGDSLQKLAASTWDSIHAYQAISGIDDKVLGTELLTGVDKEDSAGFKDFLSNVPDTAKNSVKQYLNSYYRILMVGIKEGQEKLTQMLIEGASTINDKKKDVASFVPFELDEISDEMDFDAVFKNKGAANKIYDNLIKNRKNNIAGKQMDTSEQRKDMLQRYIVGFNEFTSSVSKLINEENELNKALDEAYDSSTDKEIEQLTFKIAQKKAEIYKYIAGQKRQGSKNEGLMKNWLKNNVDSKQYEMTHAEKEFDKTGKSPNYLYPYSSYRYASLQEQFIPIDWTNQQLQDIYDIEHFSQTASGYEQVKKSSDQLVAKMLSTIPGFEKVIASMQQMQELLKQNPDKEVGFLLQKNADSGKFLVGEEDKIGIGRATNRDTVFTVHSHPKLEYAYPSHAGVASGGGKGDLEAWFQSVKDFSTEAIHAVIANPNLGDEIGLFNLQAIPTKIRKEVVAGLNKVKPIKITGKESYGEQLQEGMRRYLQNFGLQNFEEIAHFMKLSDFMKITPASIQDALRGGKLIPDIVSPRSKTNESDKNKKLDINETLKGNQSSSTSTSSTKDIVNIKTEEEAHTANEEAIQKENKAKQNAPKIVAADVDKVKEEQKAHEDNEKAIQKEAAAKQEQQNIATDKNTVSQIKQEQEERAKNKQIIEEENKVKQEQTAPKQETDAVSQLKQEKEVREENIETIKKENKVKQEQSNINLSQETKKQVETDKQIKDALNQAAKSVNAKKSFYQDEILLDLQRQNKMSTIQENLGIKGRINYYADLLSSIRSQKEQIYQKAINEVRTNNTSIADSENFNKYVNSLAKQEQQIKAIVSRINTLRSKINEPDKNTKIGINEILKRYQSSDSEKEKMKEETRRLQQAQNLAKEQYEQEEEQKERFKEIAEQREISKQLAKMEEEQKSKQDQSSISTKKTNNAAQIKQEKEAQKETTQQIQEEINIREQAADVASKTAEQQINASEKIVEAEKEKASAVKDSTQQRVIANEKALRSEEEKKEVQKESAEVAKETAKDIEKAFTPITKEQLKAQLDEKAKNIPLPNNLNDLERTLGIVKGEGRKASIIKAFQGSTGIDQSAALSLDRALLAYNAQQQAEYESIADAYMRYRQIQNYYSKQLAQLETQSDVKNSKQEKPKRTIKDIKLEAKQRKEQAKIAQQSNQGEEKNQKQTTNTISNVAEQQIEANNKIITSEKEKQAVQKESVNVAQTSAQGIKDLVNKELQAITKRETELKKTDPDVYKKIADTKKQQRNNYLEQLKTLETGNYRDDFMSLGLNLKLAMEARKESYKEIAKNYNSFNDKSSYNWEPAANIIQGHNSLINTIVSRINDLNAQLHPNSSDLSSTQILQRYEEIRKSGIKTNKKDIETDLLTNKEFVEYKNNIVLDTPEVHNQNAEAIEAEASAREHNQQAVQKEGQAITDNKKQMQSKPSPSNSEIEPKDVVGPFKPLTREEILKQLDSMKSLSDEEILKKYNIPKTKTAKTRRAKLQKALSDVNMWNTVDEEIDKLIADSMGTEEPAFWKADPSDLMERLRAIKDQAVTSQRLQEWLSEYPAEDTKVKESDIKNKVAKPDSKTSSQDQTSSIATKNAETIKKEEQAHLDNKKAIAQENAEKQKSKNIVSKDESAKVDKEAEAYNKKAEAIAKENDERNIKIKTPSTEQANVQVHEQNANAIQQETQAQNGLKEATQQTTEAIKQQEQQSKSAASYQSKKKLTSKQKASINKIEKDGLAIKQREKLSEDESLVTYQTLPHQTAKVKYVKRENGKVSPEAISFNTDFKGLSSDLQKVDTEILKIKADFKSMTTAERTATEQAMAPVLAALERRKSQLEKELDYYSGSEDYAIDVRNVKQQVAENHVSTVQELNAKKEIADFEKVSSIIDKAREKIQSFGNEQRTGAWTQSVTDAVKTMQLLEQNMHNPDKVEEYNAQLQNQLKILGQIQNESLIQNKNGYLLNQGQIQSAADMTNQMNKYAEAMQLGSLVSEKWSNNNTKLTRTYKTTSGQITQLTGQVEKLSNAWRMSSTVSQGSNAFMTGFSKSIGGVIRQLPQLIMGYSAVMKIRSELTAGMNTFKEYDSTLTNISYTMNMTSKELDALGKSAIDMAKDLSMSVANAEGVYKIYANMNTSAEEIQKLAKPTVILSNLSGVDASTAADEVQGIIQQFDMLKDAEADAADVSMHVVDVLNDISANVAMDYSFN